MENKQKLILVSSLFLSLFIFSIAVIIDKKKKIKISNIETGSVRNTLSTTFVLVEHRPWRNRKQLKWPTGLWGSNETNCYFESKFCAFYFFGCQIELAAAIFFPRPILLTCLFCQWAKEVFSVSTTTDLTQHIVSPSERTKRAHLSRMLGEQRLRHQQRATVVTLCWASKQPEEESSSRAIEKNNNKKPPKRP